jgi:polygalacturonase
VKDPIDHAGDRVLLSRREWLGKLALPATGAVIATGLFESSPAAGAGTKPALMSNDLGARVYNIREYGATGDGATLDTAAL